MTLNEKYWQIRKQELPIIFGKKLKPLTLGHRYLLRQIDSNFLKIDKELPTVEDLIIATVICSNDYKTAKSLISDEIAYCSYVRKWLASFKVVHGLYKIIGLAKEIDLSQKIIDFVKYLYPNDLIPTFKYYQDSVKEITIPEELFVKVFLQKHLHYSDEEIFEKLWYECIWEVIVVNSMEGACELIDDDEFDEMLNKGKELINRIKDVKWQ